MKKLFNETEWDRVLLVISIFLTLLWFFPCFALVLIFMIILVQTA